MKRVDVANSLRSFILGNKGRLTTGWEIKRIFPMSSIENYNYKN